MELKRTTVCLDNCSEVLHAPCDAPIPESCEPLSRIELLTPSLPRKCSTPELQRRRCSQSGRRGSNPPPEAWKASALPNELLPQKWASLQVKKHVSYLSNLPTYQLSSLPVHPFITCFVGGGGFEPPKAAPTDLQSAPFDRSGIPPIYSSGDKMMNF